jgi:hypothetical protein
MEAEFREGKAHGAARIVQETDTETITCSCTYVDGRRFGRARIECVRAPDARWAEDQELTDEGGGGRESETTAQRQEWTRKEPRFRHLTFHAHYGDYGEVQTIVAFDTFDTSHGGGEAVYETAEQSCDRAHQLQRSRVRDWLASDPAAKSQVSAI